MEDADTMEDGLRAMQATMSKNERRMGELAETLPSIVEAAKIARQDHAPQPTPFRQD